MRKFTFKTLKNIFKKEKIRGVSSLNWGGGLYLGGGGKNITGSQ